VRALLDLPQPPDAVCAVLERYALSALAVAEERGIAVPEALRVAAASDSAAARNARLPVTVLDLHPDQVGRAAVDLLLRRVDGADGGPTHRLVAADLVVRASTVG